MLHSLPKHPDWESLQNLTLCIRDISAAFPLTASTGNSTGFVLLGVERHTHLLALSLR